MKSSKIVIAIILSLTSCHTIIPVIVPYIELRSQGLDTPRHLVGLIQDLYTLKPIADTVHGAVGATLFYNRSFNTNAITQAFFGINHNESIIISGSQVANRSATDWLADYFYLPTDYQSAISFSPRIDNIGAELSFFIDLSEWAPGLYCELYAPLVHTRWNLNMCEMIDVMGTNTMAPGYFTPATLARDQLLENFTQYISGVQASPVIQTVGPTEFTTTFAQLRNAKIATGERNQTRLADMRLAIGYDFLRKERIMLGVQALVVLPVGNRPAGDYLFDPVAGNGHHWELGGSLIGTGTLWQSEDQESELLITVDALATHFFTARQHHTFDLEGKPFSRYMLMERLGTPVLDNLTGNGVAPSAQFQEEFQPVANLTNVAVDVSAAIQAEITALITLACRNFSWDIGYNFWMRSCEHQKMRGPNPFSKNSNWALKGDASVYGFDRGSSGAGPLVGAVALSATQSGATINAGLNIPGRTAAQAALNPAIDNPTNSAGDASNGSANNPLSANPDSAALTIQTSVNPVFILPTALSDCGAPTTRGLSNKIFSHISYAWHERDGWVPYLGLGGEVEFAAHKNNHCAPNCDSCVSCALSQWGLWLKGGLFF